MKIAIIHDYLFSYGGAERVLEALHEIWPEAPVYTAWVDWKWLGKNKPEWQGWDIRASWFDKLPFKSKLCSLLRFLAPKVWSSFDLNGYDLVLSSSAWYMPKAVSLYNPKPKHLCYCHTPPRYLYGYDTARNIKHPLVRFYALLVNPFMRYFDFKSSQKIDLFIANSKEVQQRISKFYRMDSKVVYPPITSVKSEGSNKSEGYFLMVNRLVGSKNTNIAIKACLKMGLSLKIVGEGPDRSSLEKLTGNNRRIEFLGYVKESDLVKLYKSCEAVIYLPKDEDFGIVPVEANSYGKAVIGVNAGGVKETVLNGKTGILINSPKVSLVIKAIKELKNMKINLFDCKAQASKFTKDRFKKEIKSLANSLL